MVYIGIGVLVLLAIFIFVAYLLFPPKFADKHLISVFNKFSGILTLVLVLLFYFNGRLNLPFSQDLRELMAVLLAVFLELFLLVIFTIIRNFWLFKPPRNR